MRVSEEVDGLQEGIAWFLDYLLAERSASVHTVAAYEQDLMQFARHFKKNGGNDWAEVEPGSLAAYMANLSKKQYAVTTIQRKTAALRSFLRFLARRGAGPGETAIQLGIIRKPKTLPKALSAEKLERLITAPNVSEPAGVRDRTILETLYGVGLRVTELVALRLEHYGEAESLFRVFGKGSKTRVIPIPAVTHDWIRRYLLFARPALAKSASGSHFFLNQKGKKMSRSGVFRILRNYAKACGIEEKLSPHTLRHTYAAHLVQAGADIRAVQELLGHASVTTTEVYTHLDLATIKQKYLEAHPRATRRK